jgi:hypothetical protein
MQSLIVAVNHIWILTTKQHIKYIPNIDPLGQTKSTFYILYYLLTFKFLLGADSDSIQLKEFLHAKIEKRKKQIHPAHNPRFNHDLQLEIDCIEWALKKIEVNKIPNDRLEAVIRSMIKDLEKRKDKAMKRQDTYDFWIKIESSMGSICYLCYKE